MYSRKKSSPYDSPAAFEEALIEAFDTMKTCSSFNEFRGYHYHKFDFLRKNDYLYDVHLYFIDDENERKEFKIRWFEEKNSLKFEKKIAESLRRVDDYKNINELRKLNEELYSFLVDNGHYHNLCKVLKKEVEFDDDK